MAAIAGYDAELQMIIEAPQEADQKHLEYIKWLVDTGRLEGDTAPIVLD